MWIKISQEEAQQHPLFGVRGSLLFVGCLMIVLVLLDPPVQIIAKKMAGLRPTFVPGAYFVILIVATWSLFRRKAYVRTYIYCLGALTIIGLGVLFYMGDVPYVPCNVEDGLLTLLVKDIPLCSYFTWSRRARVTLECRVRSDDPLIRARDVTATQNDAQPARANSLPAPGIDHKPCDPRPTQRDEAVSATSSQDQPRDGLEPQNKFELLLQYSPSVRDAYAEISHLPEELKQRFRAAVVEPGAHHQAKAIGARVLDEHRKRMCPFDSSEANDFLAKARELGSAAEKEFMDVMQLLGPSSSAAQVFAKVNDKHGANAILSRRITAWSKDI